MLIKYNFPATRRRLLATEPEQHAKHLLCIHEFPLSRQCQMNLDRILDSQHVGLGQRAKLAFEP